jgi:hypothetical protein
MSPRDGYISESLVAPYIKYTRVYTRIHAYTRVYVYANILSKINFILKKKKGTTGGMVGF